VLVSDCLSAYDKIDCEKHKCYAHHLRALSDFNEQYADSELIPKLKAKLREAMELDERFDELEGDQARAELDELRFEMASLLLDEKDHPVDEKAAARLRTRFGELFTFVGRPEVDATNNQAERELRPAVITRKISSGNKTDRGARSWQILKSIERTLDRQGRDFLSYLEKTLSLSGTPPPLGPN
jgi:transposase